MILGPLTTLCQGSTPIQDSKLQNALKWIEKGRQDSLKLKSLQHVVDTCLSRIGNLEVLISAYDLKDTAYKIITQSYKDEIESLKKEVVIAEKGLKKLDKNLRRYKRMIVFVGIAGPVITSVIFIFVLK